MTFPEILAPLLEGRDLSAQQAEATMRYLTGGEATEAQIGGLLLLLRAKGVKGTELAGFARVLRASAARVEHPYDDLVDTCGTGGGCASFNLSTAAAIVASAAGARVAKHGNRGVSSPCGSAHVLEALGVRLGEEPGRLAERLGAARIAFLFAPAHHPAMRHVGKARRELGVRTVFNALGPLANPAGARRQLVGVYDTSLLRPVGEALALLGAERALVVRGEDGLDEVSPSARTMYVKVWHGRVEEGALTPGSFGLEPVAAEAIAPGATIEENATILREAVSDPGSPRARAILPSAATALWLAGLEGDLHAAAERALTAIAMGAAARKLEEIAA